MRNFDEPESNEAWSDVEQHVQRYRRVGANPKTARSIVNKLLVKRGYNQKQANGALVELWSSIVPRQWQGDSSVKGCRRGTLEVKVTDPIVLQQLEFSKQQLLQSIRSKHPEQRITNIRFSLN
ncbi:MAG: DUF721 domain-containing protein [Planctomycetaceae bacterium]|nr:DUF721 domain-containing protein [Planctomycetaceae bacterium]